MRSIEPKLQFLRSKDAADFANAVNTPIVRQAIEVALQQFVVDQARGDSADAALKAHYELQGAKRYVSILLNLTEVEEPYKPDKSGILQCQPRPQSQPPLRQSKPTNPPRS